MQIVENLAEISDRYDAVFCDLWGCLHNGVVAFDEAVEALRDSYSELLISQMGDFISRRVFTLNNFNVF